MIYTKRMFRNPILHSNNRKGFPDSGLVVSLLLPIAFLAWNLHHYSGPAYLSDEIGYLSKAALLGGHVVDKATGYHVGYAFFLAPLFAIFTSPWMIWKGVLAVNAAFWAGSFLVLRRLLLRWFPDVSQDIRNFALFVAAIYPAWFAISGYAFPSSAFVFIFMLCVSSLFSWNGKSTRSLLPHSFLVGFLYWIHPTAVGVGLASFCVVLLVGAGSRKYLVFFLHLVMTLGLFYLYHKLVGPLINAAMTPSGYKVYWEYPKITSLIAGLLDKHVFTSFVARMFGEFSYLAIATFGLALFGALFCIRKSGSRHFLSARRLHTASAAEGSLQFLFLPLAMIFIIAMGSLMFAALKSSGTDHWIYGRYLEGALLPLLACGLIELSRSRWKTRVTLAASTFVVLAATGWAIDHLGASTTSGNQVNLAAFWPEYLFGKGGFFFWGLVGSLGVWGLCILEWQAALVLMACSLVICSVNQVRWHENILESYSNPSSIVNVIKRNFPPGSCVGFDDVLPREGNPTFNTLGESLGKYFSGKYKYNLSLYQLERYSLYSFYLYNYRYRRMVANEWRSHCNGPLLTYVPDQYVGHKNEYIVAREEKSDLFMVVKRARLDIPLNLRRKSGVVYAEDSGRSCLIKGCFSMDGFGLSQYTQVGKLTDGMLTSTGKSGFLFFGPYRALRAGAYELTVQGSWSASDSAWVDVVANRGDNVIAKLAVRPQRPGSHEMTLSFVLSAPVQDLEIRFHVGANDRAAISSYQIRSVDEAPD